MTGNRSKKLKTAKKIKKLSSANKTSGGRKFDGGKLRYDLVPIEALEGLAKVLTYGAEKYEPNNWQGVESERYVAALFRHIMAWRKGEQLDSESGHHHLEHALANVAFLLYKDLKDE